MLLEAIKQFNIPVVQSFASDGDLTALIAHTRSLKNTEGFIVAFDDGHKLKIKTDEYVRIHKALDRIRFDRNIVDLILNEEMDDVVPLMPPHEVDRVRDFERHFWASFEGTEMRLRNLFNKAQEHGDRKSIATQFIPTLSNKSDAPFIFRMLDGKSIRELMLDHLHKCIGTNTKWEECAKWLGM